MYYSVESTLSRLEVFLDSLGKRQQRVVLST